MRRAVHQRAGRYSVPRPRRSALHRERLTARLHENIGNGLAVLQAPAGFGKTTLLTGFASSLAGLYQVAWLTLDASCSAPETLARHLAAALLGEDATWAPASATKIDDLKSYLGSVCNALAGSAEAPVLLVIENAHELRESDDAAELVAWLIELLPPGAEVVLSGREPSRLLEVDRRVAAGEALLLDATDLAFTADEAAALVAAAGSDLSPERVLKATNGWPIAVMAVISGTISLAGAERAHGGDAWERYLFQEVWKAIPEPFQHTLLALSVAPVIEREIATRLVGEGPWRQVAPWLVSATLLGEALEQGFRLNPQVKRFLLAEFEVRAPERFADVVAQAATFLEQRGETADAIELARQAGCTVVLAGILERSGRELILQGAFGVLWRAYQALTPELLAARPLLRGMGSRILAHHSRANEALEAAESVLEDPTASAAARQHALLGKARAYRLLARVPELLSIFDTVRTAVDCDDPAIAAELAWQEAQVVLATTSEFERAERLLLAGIENSRQSSAPVLELLMRSTLGQLYATRGDGPDAINELTRAAQGWRALRGTGNLGWVLNNLGMAYLAVGDFESAVAVLEEARNEGRACENVRNEAYATASLGDAHLALGHFEEARTSYEEAIRVCATDVLDESLAALSIAGLAAAHLGQGDLKEADFFSRRATLVAEAFGNPLEVGYCRLQQATVDDAAQDHAAAAASARDAIDLFRPIDARAPLRMALYRLAMCLFRGGRRAEAQEALHELNQMVTEPWMAGPLVPLIREQPMFAQWAASRALPARWFRDLLERQSFAPLEEPEAEEKPARLPRVVARSLGQLHITVGGREVTDEAWASSRAKEMFFLFLANRGGLRKEEAAVALYPDVSPEGCNSAFHSNLYRLRRALYQDSIIKRDGAYLLNPEAEFEWDVDLFLGGLESARRLDPGTPERARATEEALAHYAGPFADAFFSEWASGLRTQLLDRRQQALSSLAGYHASRKDFDAAAECLERVLEADQYNEQAAFDLATYRMRSGGAAAALSFLDAYRGRIREELGEDLPQRFNELRRRIAAGAL